MFCWSTQSSNLQKLCRTGIARTKERWLKRNPFKYQLQIERKFATPIALRIFRFDPRHRSNDNSLTPPVKFSMLRSWANGGRSKAWTPEYVISIKICKLEEQLKIWIELRLAMERNRETKKLHPEVCNFWNWEEDRKAWPLITGLVLSKSVRQNKKRKCWKWKRKRILRNLRRNMGS